MRRFLFVLLFLSSTTTQAQEFQVLEITPASGPSTGGTLVKIRMNQLPNCPILPPQPSVTFGNASVTATTFGPDMFVTTAPAHAPGPVDVTIHACGMDPLTVPQGFSFFQQGSGDPFRVLSVSPATGSTFGGTEVTVAVDDLPACSGSGSPMLTFGGANATNVRQNQTASTITGITPAHADGTFAVTVLNCAGQSVTVQSGFTFNGNDPDGYERVLFPVFFFGPGAYGADWATSITVHNAGDTTVTVANPVFRGSPDCDGLCGCSALSTVEPGKTAEVCETNANPAGLMFYAPKLAAGDLHYHIRAFDLSRSTKNAGTEMPVVRERQFRTDEIVLQQLPLDEHFRLALRVYSPDQVDGAQVRMEVLDPAGAVIGERVFTLSYPINPIVYDPLSPFPSFVYVGDLDTILRGMAGGQPPARVALKITPVSEGLRFWAFASITNNETQLITTVSPQD